MRSHDNGDYRKMREEWQCYRGRPFKILSNENRINLDYKRCENYIKRKRKS